MWRKNRKISARTQCHMQTTTSKMYKTNTCNDETKTTTQNIYILCIFSVAIYLIVLFLDFRTLTRPFKQISRHNMTIRNSNYNSIAFCITIHLIVCSTLFLSVSMRFCCVVLLLEKLAQIVWARWVRPICIRMTTHNVHILHIKLNFDLWVKLMEIDHMQARKLKNWRKKTHKNKVHQSESK